MMLQRIQLLNSISVFETDLTELKAENNTICIPEHILADVPKLKPNYPLTVENLRKVQKLRTEAFSECCYADLNLPFVPFKVSPKIRDSYRECERWLEQVMRDGFRFIKSCKMSPKDLDDRCIFETAQKALSALENSERTRDCKGLHIIAKLPRKFTAEYRCFLVADRLSFVVSRTELTNEIKNEITAFFQKYRYDFPRHSVCVEIGKSEHGIEKKSLWEIIEINAFGPDLICDPTPLEFSQDWEKIYGTGETLWFEV